MSYKPIRRILTLLLVLTMVRVQPMPSLWADLDAPQADVEIELSEASVGPLGGYTQTPGGELRLEPFSQPAAPLIQQDYQDIRNDAQNLLDRATDFRTNEISVVPADTLENALKNYRDFNDGELFYRFCADYDNVDARGYCPESGPGGTSENVRNKLLDALGLFAVLLTAPDDLTIQVGGNTTSVREAGREGILAATREIANVHLIFGNEFLIDATDYRFSLTAQNADQIINEELAQLDLALQQFQMASGALIYAFNVPLGGEVRDFLLDDRRIGDYFTSREFELFGVASNRQMSTLNEIATRYLVRGQKAEAQSVYRNAFTRQYMQVTALADKANAQSQGYLANGSWEMLNNLSQLRARAQAVEDGIDPFGFAPDYVPLQSYDDLLELVEGPAGNASLLATAEGLEQQARDAQRQFDQNKGALSAELDDLEGAFNDDLFELCGAIDNTCRGGLMKQNLIAIKAANKRVALAWERARNIAKQIGIEEDRAGKVINVHLGLGREISAAQLAIGKLEAYKETRTLMISSENRHYSGHEESVREEVTVGAKVSATASVNPLKCSVETETYAEASVTAAMEQHQGYEHSDTCTISTEVTWDPNAEAIAGYESLIALKEAEAEADIEGANSAAVIKNLLLQQSELLIEYEVALEEFNQLAAEHNYLASRYSRLHNKRAEATSEVIEIDGYKHNPAYRVMRDTLTVQSAQALATAAQYAYFSAKAVEYDILSPYPAIGDVYKARTSNDIRLFLDALKAFELAASRPGQLNRYPRKISVAQHILGLTDQNLDPDGVLLPEQVAALRTQRFQEFLQRHIALNQLEVQFATSLDYQVSDTQYLFSPNIWNNRIAGIGLIPGTTIETQGVHVNLVTRQTGSVGEPEVQLVHGGQASYRTPTRQRVIYDPGQAMPVGYVLPPGLDPVDITVLLVPGINGVGAVSNAGLQNLSVAASSWALRIPANAKGALDYSQIEDIEIFIDTTGRALAGSEKQALDDARRLQAGLEMAPVTERRVEHIATSVAAPRPALAVSAPGTLSGSYLGSVLVTSPISAGVLELSLNLVDVDGVLTGALRPERTSLYPESMTLHGTRDGDLGFTLASSVASTGIDGCFDVEQSFTIEGAGLLNGDILTGTYTSVINGLTTTPVVVKGTFYASRPSEPGLTVPYIDVQAKPDVVPTDGHAGVAASILQKGEPVTAPDTITFTTSLGTVTPQTVDTANGVALATFTAGSRSGMATITATNGSFVGTTQVQVGSGIEEVKIYLPVLFRKP